MQRLQGWSELGLQWEQRWPGGGCRAGRKVVSGEATRGCHLRPHSLQGLGEDFRPHPKKQKAVEGFLAEWYHNLI